MLKTFRIFGFFSGHKKARYLLGFQNFQVKMEKKNFCPEFLDFFSGHKKARYLLGFQNFQVKMLKLFKPEGPSLTVLYF